MSTTRPIHLVLAASAALGLAVLCGRPAGSSAAGEASATGGTKPATVYTSDFTKAPGTPGGPGGPGGSAGQWSTASLDKTPKGEHPFLGRFATQTVTLTLTDLPEHRYLKVSFDLLVMGKWVGNDTGVWQARLTGGTSGTQAQSTGALRLIRTGFDLHAFNEDPAARARQAYPDEYPVGRQPAQAGAANSGALGYEAQLGPFEQAGPADATYKMTFIVPHAGPNAVLEFAGLGIGKVDKIDDPAWGLDHVKIEALPAPTPGAAAPDATPRALAPDSPNAGGIKALEAAFDGLGSIDKDKTWDGLNALVLGGDAAVKVIVDKSTGAVDTDLVAKLITQLDADTFDTRNEATDKLLALGGRIESQIKAALAKEGISAEARNRLEQVQTAIAAGEGATGKDALAAARAVRALELIGTDAAQAAIKTLAEKGLTGRGRSEAGRALAQAARARADLILAKCQAVAREGDTEPAAKFVTQAQTVLKDAGLKGSAAVDFTLRALPKIAQARAQAAKLAAMSVATAPRDRAKLLVTELDDPAEATKGAPGDLDATLKTVITLANTDPAKLTVKDHLDLASAYRALAIEAPEYAKPALFRRALTQYQAALATPKAGADAVKLAAAGLVESAASITQWEHSIDGWIDLLKLADTAHGDLGQWSTSDKGEVSVKNAGGCKLTLPVVPHGSYELEVKFIITDGGNGVYIALPAGLRGGTGGPGGPGGAGGTGGSVFRGNLNLGGWNNTISGFEQIDGAGADNNPTTKNPHPIDPNTDYTFTTTVQLAKDKVTVTVKQNNEDFLTWEGDPSALSNHFFWRNNDPCSFALGANGSDVTFKSVRVRMIEGYAEVER